MIVLLQSCTTIDNIDKKEEQKPSIQNVIEGLKSIKLF